MYTISEVSDILGISAHTLRFYDKEGLLPELAKGVNNQRLFGPQAMEWVCLIQCLRKTGMPLADIRGYIEACEQGDGTLGERYQMIKRQKERTREELKAVKERLKMLEYKEQYYKALIKGEEFHCNCPSVADLVKEKTRKKKQEIA